MLKDKSQFDFLKKGYHFEKETFKIPKPKPDLITRSFYLFVIISWMLFAASIFYLVSAMPQSDNLFTKVLKAKMNYNWKIDRLAEFARYNLILLFVSTITIIFNLQRLKRKSDTLDYFNIFTAVYSIAGIIFYLYMR